MGSMILWISWNMGDHYYNFIMSVCVFFVFYLNYITVVIYLVMLELKGMHN